MTNMLHEACSILKVISNALWYTQIISDKSS